jgi:hypothetical protein
VAEDSRGTVCGDFRDSWVDCAGGGPAAETLLCPLPSALLCVSEHWEVLLIRSTEASGTIPAVETVDVGVGVIGLGGVNKECVLVD